jgi:hypothetical protein
MAAIDYYGLEQAIKTRLEAYAPLAGVRVLIEEPMQSALADTGNIVCVYLESRVPHGSQFLANGEQTRFLIRFSIWVASFHMEGMAAALEARDDLIGKVELALMADRTLGSNVDTSWLEGGELFALAGQGFPFTAGGEIILIADKSAVS